MKKPAERRASGLVLGIETASALGGVALVSDAGDLLGEITLRNHENHAERILPALDWLLATLGSAPSALAAVAVSSGPGSFTGLRAGIAAAKGLSFSLGVPLYGVPTLEALAANAPPGDGPVCAVLNARRGEVFRAHFGSGPAGPERLGPDALVPVAALAGELPAGCLLIGELPPLSPDPFPPGGAVRLAPPHLRHPRAAVIALLGLAALGAARDSELGTLLPRYLRPWDAAAGPPAAQIACTGGELRAGPVR